MLINTKNKYIIQIIIVLLIFLISSINIYAIEGMMEDDFYQKPTSTSVSKKAPEWIMPDVYTLQTAGFLGFIVGGAGYTFFDDFWEISAVYGYVPEAIGGHDIHTLALKTNIYPFDFTIFNILEICPFYFGLALLFALDKEAYWTESTEAPDGYYFPTGIHFVFNFGLQILYKLNENGSKIGLFAEVSFLDTYTIAYFYEDHEYLKFEDCLTAAIGVRYFY